MNINIRIYGILLADFNGCKNLLVSKEYYKGFEFLKLPGGGLEFGEGIHDCLKREFLEELNLSVEVGDLYYVNDFFQPSKFNNDQVVSIYYFVKANESDLHKFEAMEIIPHLEGGDNYFKWIPWDKLNSSLFDLPIDKVVIEKLLRQ